MSSGHFWSLELEKACHVHDVPIQKTIDQEIQAGGGAYLEHSSVLLAASFFFLSSYRKYPNQFTSRDTHLSFNCIDTHIHWFPISLHCLVDDTTPPRTPRKLVRHITSTFNITNSKKSTKMTSTGVNRPTDLKVKEADVNRKLQFYGIASAFQAGKVPSVRLRSSSSTSALSILAIC
jgi:hypothetical protein